MLGLVVLLWGIELTIGIWSHSVSLLADAGHLFSDVGGLLLALLANWFAQKPAMGRATFGYKRLEVLAALVNGMSLLAIALFIAWESLHRLQLPATVLSYPMLLGAGAGLLVNGLNLLLLHRHSQNDLNLRGAFLHVVADIASSVSVLLGAVILYCVQWSWIDAGIGLFIACITGLSAIPLMWSSLEILLDYAPSGVAPATVITALTSFPGVLQVRNLRIWAIAPNHLCLCAHLYITPEVEAERDRLLDTLQSHLKEQFSIQESTLQLMVEEAIATRSLHPLFNQNLTVLVTSR